jgi:hypothetical protein
LNECRLTRLDAGQTVCKERWLQIPAGSATERAGSPFLADLVLPRIRRRAACARHERTDDLRVARAKRDLGWKPVSPLREGLERTIAYFDDLLRRSNRAPLGLA